MNNGLIIFNDILHKTAESVNVVAAPRDKT